MILFTQGIATDKINMAYNNNVIRFATDSVEQYLNAQLIVGGQSLIIYPSPDDSFYFNFKEYVTTFVNGNNFLDTVQTSLDAGDYESFTYGGNGYVNLSFTITVNYSNNTSETQSFTIPFLAGVQQIETFKKNVTQTNDDIILLPLRPNSNNKYYAKYYEGYPFDVSFLQQTLIDLDLTNNSNLLYFTFKQKGFVTRLFFSDGRIDESIIDFLPIALGINEISWLDKFLYIDKVDVCSGVYVKWFNNYGGYSYWLFPNFAKRTQSMRNIGELNTDFENLPSTSNQVTQIGIEAGQRLTVNSDKLNENEFNLLSTILTSPKVWLFTGEPFSQSESNDWMEVKILNTTQTTRNLKGQSLDITLDIELPDLYTMTL
jgi:hypothetical protein